QIAEDPVAVRQRIRPPYRSAPSCERAIDPVEVVCDRGEALALGAVDRRALSSLAKRRIFDKARELGAGELRLSLYPRRGGDCAAGSCSLQGDASEAVECGYEDRGFREQRRACFSVACSAHGHPAAKRARDRRTSAQRLRAEEDEIPAGRLL